MKAVKINKAANIVSIAVMENWKYWYILQVMFKEYHNEHTSDELLQPDSLWMYLGELCEN